MLGINAEVSWGLRTCFLKCVKKAFSLFGSIKHFERFLTWNKKDLLLLSQQCTFLYYEVAYSCKSCVQKE